MKSHDLARWLLSQPNSEVFLETGQGRKEVQVKSVEWFDGQLPKQDCLVVLRNKTHWMD